MLAEEIVVVDANPRREVQVRVQRADRKTASCCQGFEEPELD
jgi:hypothetical protein